MSLFSCGRQPGLCRVGLAALLAHLLELLSDVLFLQFRKLVSVEVPGHVDAEVSGRDPLQLDELFCRYLREAGNPSCEVYDSSRASHEVHRPQQRHISVVLRLERVAGHRSQPPISLKWQGSPT